jgi:hypothetical protein
MDQGNLNAGRQSSVMEGRHQDKSKKISDIFHNAADSEHSKLQ